MPFYPINALLRTLGILAFLALPLPLAYSADPPASGPKWGNDADTTPSTGFKLIPRGESVIKLGPPDSPFCLLGAQALNINTGQPVGVPIENIPKHRKCAFSRDGKFFACAVVSADQRETSFHIWDLSTGKVCAIIPAARDYADFLAFSASDFLITSGYPGPGKPVSFFLWDPQTGARVRDFPVTEGTCNASLTPDGKYLAVAGPSSISVYAIKTGLPIASMDPPGTVKIPQYTAAQPDAGDPSGLLRRDTFPHGRVAFSPDGSQLMAQTQTYGESRICVWDTAGKLMEDIYYAGESDSPGAGSFAAVQWSPDGQAWLINQRRVIDRVSKRQVMIMQFPNASSPSLRFLDKDHLLLVMAPDKASKVVDIPWDAARKSLRVMDSPALPAALRPGQAISLNFKIQSALGSSDEAVKLLTRSVQKVAARYALTIAERQSAAINITVTESPADRLPVYERTTLGFIERDSGKSVQLYKCKATFEISVAGKTTPIYSKEFVSKSSTAYSTSDSTGITEQLTHTSMLEFLARTITQVDAPYFIPSTPDLDQLPINIPLK
jgi:hypothetical protein